MRNLILASIASFITFWLFFGLPRAAVLTIIGFAVVLIWELKAGRISIALTRKAKAKQLIDSVLLDFYALKKTFPDMDEHWYLAETWLRRYKKPSRVDHIYRVLPNSTIADIKATEPARLHTFAWIETHQFAILDSPKSIAALSNYILYKEMPQQALYYATQYSELMKPVLEAEEKGDFILQYRRQNQKTYESIMAQSEADSELKQFFLGIELEQSNPELVKKLRQHINKSKERNP